MVRSKGLEPSRLLGTTTSRLRVYQFHHERTAAKINYLRSLRIRISDALKWLADQFKAGDPSMEPYAHLKRRLRFTATDSALRLHLKRPHAYRPVPHLDPAIRARLQSALQRPDIKPTTRAKIEAVLDPRKHHLPTVIDGSTAQ